LFVLLQLPELSNWSEFPRPPLTSGHGVCGISRFSLRGIVATVFYILAGGIVVVFFRHLLGVI
jgi:hypothetical protein